MQIAKTQPLGASMKSWKGVQGGRYYLVQSMDQFWEFWHAMRREPTIAVDTETSGFDIIRDRACGLVFGWGVEHNFYLPIAHKTKEPQLDLERIREPLCEILEDENVTKIFWNEKFDRHFLRSAGMEVKGVRHDGVVLVHLLDENTGKGLKEMSKRYISHAADKWEIAITKWRVDEAKRRRSEFSKLLTTTLKEERTQLEADFFAQYPFIQFSGLTKAQITARLKKYLRQKLSEHPLAKNKKDDISYDYIPLDAMVPYACADVHYTMLLYKDLLVKVAQHDDLRKLYINECQLADLLFEVESRGIKVDVPYLAELEPQFKQEISDLEEEIHADVGHKFEIGSNPQLVEALIKAGCRLSKLTKKGKELAQEGKKPEPKHYSTDDETLEYLATQYPFAAKIREYRKRQKLLNTYVVKIQQLADENHYLHSQFNANVSTGRMSSREPNVQNIPGRDTRIRKAFTIPEELGFENQNVDDSEWVYVFMDYSQVELRLTAHHSQDPTFLGAYPWDGPAKDVHSITCAEAVMGITTEDFLKVYEDENHPDFKEYKWFRNIAKRVNFGIIYGAGPGAIQRQVSSPERFVSRDECTEYIAKYFDKYQGVKEWINRTTFLLNRYGYLQNTFGRYRRLPDARAREKWKRERAGRQGVNFLIQGDAADLFKHAAVRVRRLLREEGAKTKVVNFVHDEIQFYWHKDEFHLLKPVKEVMEDFPQYSVPIVADIEMSHRNWADKKGVKAA
jgi:DNA polymerase I-like protein with 3'-5' exonuclease and polymerase domains